MSKGAFSGGCQRGAVRFRLDASPRDFMHCRCCICRRGHGALFATAGVYDKAAVTIEQGGDDLSRYESSPRNHRLFCSYCGGQVFLTIGTWADRMSVVLGSLDPGQHPGHDPACERHIFWDEKVCWHDVGDTLPKQEGYGST